MDKEINYTFWGKSIDTNWYEWYQAVKAMFEKNGCKITHLGINSESYNPKGAVTAARKEKALVEILKSGEVPLSVDLYSVPKDFTTVIGDSDIICFRRKDLIFVIVRERIMTHIDEDSILEMKKFIKFESGEMFSANSCNSFFYSITRDKERAKHHNYEFIKNIEA